MCFSATASFVSSGILGTLGTASLMKSSTPEQKYFAVIPFIFASQQFSEGIVWLSFTHPELYFLNTISVKAFLFFATVLWPFWVPFSIYKLETNEFKRKIHKVVLFLGSVFSLGALYFLITSKCDSNIDGYHVYYKVNMPQGLKTVSNVLYLVATLVPLLIAGNVRIRYLGMLIALSYLITRFYYKDHLISVWCFFAAIISSLVYLIITYRIKVFKPSVRS